MISARYDTQDILATITYEEHSFYDNLHKDEQERYVSYLINRLVREGNGRIAQLRRRRKILWILNMYYVKCVICNMIVLNVVNVVIIAIVNNWWLIMYYCPVCKKPLIGSQFKANKETMYVVIAKQKRSKVLHYEPYYSCEDRCIMNVSQSLLDSYKKRLLEETI